MNILSHRGYWNIKSEGNSQQAFERSFTLGYGAEADFRDYQGQVFIAHNPPSEEPNLSAEQLFSILTAFDKNLPLAINIKSDGLQMMLKEALELHDVRNYFLFDMSIPDALQSLKAGLRIFVRQSDIEPDPQLYAQSQGVWMDSFDDDSWITVDTISRHLDSGKAVCMVSPELHGRFHGAFWERIHDDSLIKHPNFMICTDIPEQANIFFNHD